MLAKLLTLAGAVGLVVAFRLLPADDPAPPRRPSRHVTPPAYEAEWERADQARGAGSDGACSRAIPDDRGDSPSAADLADPARQTRRDRSGTRQIAELFSRLDRNSDGRLDPDELPAALRAGLSRRDIDEVGAIGPAEFRLYSESLIDPQLEVASPEEWQTGNGADDTVSRPSGGGARRRRSSGVSNRITSRPSGTQSEDVRHGANFGPAAATAGRGLGLAASARAESVFPPGPSGRFDLADAVPPSSTAGQFIGAGGGAGRSSPRPSQLGDLPPPDSEPTDSKAVTDPNAPATTPLPLNDGTLEYWTERNSINLKRLTAGPVSVMFLGDSAIDWFQYGAGAPLWDAYFQPAGAADFAVAGAQTSEVLWQVETGQVALASPNVVVLCVGSNNLAVGHGPEKTAAGIAKIVDRIGYHSPDTRILLLGILPRGDDDNFRTLVPETNRLISRLHDGEQVTYLDVGEWFTAADGTVRARLMPDEKHPSLTGYGVLADAIGPALFDLMTRP